MPASSSNRPLLLRRWCAHTVVQLASLSLAFAAPALLDRRQIDHQQQSSPSNRDDSPTSEGSDISPKVWVPAVVVVLVLLGGFCFVWTRTGVISRLRGAASRAVRSSTDNAATTREVTASQLTGGATIGRRTGAGARTGTNNPRTGRRNRRTPSQISTASLPVYMKEPGDQELVIFRGPEPMDASNAIAEAREAEDRDDDVEENENENGNEPENERDSASVRRMESRETMPMLDPSRGPQPGQSAMSLGLSVVEPSGEPDSSTAELLPRNTHTHQRNDSHGTTDSDGRSFLMRRVSEVPSEAPPEYNFQRDSTSSSSMAGAGMIPPGLTSDSNSIQRPTSMEMSISSPPSSPPPPSSSSPPPTSHPATPESARAAGRRSRLASRVSHFLHLRNGSSATQARSDFSLNESPRVSDASIPAPAPGSGSGIVAISLNDPPTASTSYPPPPAQSQSQTQQTGPNRHRHTNSAGSNSVSSLALPFRPLSRQRSTHTLAHQRSSGTLSSNLSQSRSHLPLSSPSALSLSLAAGAISSPLSHTLVRTEIRYPAGGPTPDQLTLLSSREGFSRFGVPYGEDAIAHAANFSTSRMDLVGVEDPDDPPPRVFESSGEEGEGSRRAREGVTGERHSEDGDGDEGDNPDALPSTSQTLTPPATTTPERNANRSVESVNVSALETRVLVPLFM